MSSGVDRLDSVIKALLSLLPQGQKIASVSVDWKEMGEFAGDAIFPVVTILYEEETKR